MNKIMPIEKGLASKIYLLAYPEPKSGYEIAKEIYGHDHHRVRKIIKELAKEGYFMTVEMDEWRTPRWFSDASLLVDKIEENKGVELNDIEKYLLQHVINFMTFREWIKTRMPRINRDIEINAGTFILDNAEILLILVGMIKSNYDTYLNIKKKDDILSYMDDFTKAMLKLIGGEPEKTFNLRFSLYIQFLSVLIPEKLIDKIRGFSSFGEKYFQLRPYFNLLENFPASIEEKDTEVIGKENNGVIVGTIKNKYGGNIEIILENGEDSI